MSILAWHFCNGWKLRDGQPIIVGKTYEYAGELILCKYGLHASRQLLDAIKYSPGNTLCRVECGGEIEEASDKLVCSSRRVIAACDVERWLHESACEIAEAALIIGDVDDERSWKSIEAKRMWLDGLIDDNKLAAACAASRDAAWEATRGAAWGAVCAASRDAAWEAAWGAAWEAAWDAAWEAAWDAAWEAVCAASRGAAREAAWAAAWGEINSALESSAIELLETTNTRGRVEEA